MRIVLDTNVIVSALVFGGVPRRIFELIEDGHHELFYSAAIQRETSRVLNTKFGWNQAALNQYLPGLWALGTKVAPKKKLKIIREDPTDDRILECAVSARAGVIVSGDRDLIRLGTFRSIAITTPRQFLDAHRPVSSA